ncbi:MAG TPA: BatB protein [Gammaproteobacteria bacterium]|nr:BatB protein [Gammaproteobacteria bacterium]
MIHFEWPWLATMVLLPPLIWWFLPARQAREQTALQVPSLARFQDLAQTGSGNRSRLQRRPLWAYMLWCLLALALMRPQWLGEPLALPTSGRDLMLGVDISGSMREDDFRYQGRMVSRLAVVKELGREFIERREGDRIGLILFGERAHVQTPLTHDRDTVQHFLGEAAVGLAGKATAIGDAIGLSLKRLRARPEESRVLILLTDGANTAGNVQPLDAARLAQTMGVRIYTIGVGTDGTGLSWAPIGGGGSDLDEKSLTDIASLTGGRYFRARNTEEMEEIYQLIDTLEPTEDEQAVRRPRHELFVWPLGTVLLGSIGWVLLAGRGRVG